MFTQLFCFFLPTFASICLPKYIILGQMSCARIVYSDHQELFVAQMNVRNLELHDKLLGIFQLPREHGP